MSWLDYLTGQALRIAGVEKTPHTKTWNIVSGATAVYNAATKAMDITITGGGGGGSGDVVGPASSVDQRIALFSGTTGKLLAQASFLIADIIKRNGSTAFTADQSMGGFKLTNLGAPSAGTDAATKAYVDGLAGGSGGGGMAFPFTYSTTTADADPGAGTFRGNNATLASATQLFFDDLEFNGTTVSGWLATFDDAVSSGKGTLRLQSESDPTKWLEFPITAYTSATGYSKITVGASRGPGGIVTTAGDTQVIFDAGATGTVPWSSLSGAIGNLGFTGLKSITHNGVVDNGNSSTADTIDWTAGTYQKSTLTGNVTYTFTAPTGVTTVYLEVIQDATGGRTITWPGSVLGSPTPPAAAPNAITWYRFDYDGTNYHLQGVDYARPEYDNGNSGSGTVTVNRSNGEGQKLTLTGNATLAANFASGLVRSMVLRVVQDATGGRSLSFSGLSFSGGIAPTVDTTPNAETFLSLYSNGTTVYCFSSARPTYSEAEFQARCGDGSDGPVTFSGSVTLTRNMYYTNITVQAGAAVNLSGHQIFYTGTLDISAAPQGSFKVNGGSATDNTGATAGPAGVGYAPNSVGGATSGSQGGAGQNAAGSAGTAAARGGNGGASGVAGSGGLGSGGAAGAGGALATVSACIVKGWRAQFVNQSGNALDLTKGGASGAGGGGGGGNGAAAGGGGGGGGAGGGVGYISGNALATGTNVNTGIFQALGGDGANGSAATNSNTGGGGGGSGGGGGWWYIACLSRTGSTITNAINVSGGDGGDGGAGNGTGDGGDGGTGGDGGRATILIGTATVVDSKGGTGSAGNNNSGTTGGTGGAKASHSVNL